MNTEEDKKTLTDILTEEKKSPFYKNKTLEITQEHKIVDNAYAYKVQAINPKDNSITQGIYLAWKLENKYHRIYVNRIQEYNFAPETKDEDTLKILDHQINKEKKSISVTYQIGQYVDPKYALTNPDAIRIYEKPYKEFKPSTRKYDYTGIRKRTTPRESAKKYLEKAIKPTKHKKETEGFEEYPDITNDESSLEGKVFMFRVNPVKGAKPWIRGAWLSKLTKNEKAYVLYEVKNGEFVPYKDNYIASDNVHPSRNDKSIFAWFNYLDIINRYDEPWYEKDKVKKIYTIDLDEDAQDIVDSRKIIEEKRKNYKTIDKKIPPHNEIPTHKYFHSKLTKEDLAYLNLIDGPEVIDIEEEHGDFIRETLKQYTFHDRIMRSHRRSLARRRHNRLDHKLWRWIKRQAN